MPSTLLFTINNEGRVYALSTGNAAWREFLYLGLEFKKISAVSHFMWAVGSDRQVYLHVHGLDVPIRIKEEAYENERWLPLEGFSNRLLPTDRYHFSSIDGTVNRSIEKIRLPSMAWQWESEWHLDCTLDGQPLDHDGWTYAVDFPAKYQIKKIWNSCVRRRKWVRFRRYSALNSWCAIAPLHKDPTEEPFIDIAIGGNNIPGAQAGTLVVWAITAHGRIMSRTGVSATSPEGLRWVAINTPSSCEVSQISVGSTGLVWCVLPNGRSIVRSGVTRDALTGVSWLEVKPPSTGLKINQISVGTNSVWCVTNDNHTWFRRGIKGDLSGTNEDAAIGSGWVEMIGNMLMVSVASNDQVFAIGSEDRALYYRFGVSLSDPTGKKWRLIQCPMQLSRTTSIASINSRKSELNSPNMKHRSLNSLDKEKARVETAVIPEIFDATSRSAPSTNQKHKLWQKPIISPQNTGSLDEKGNAYKNINLIDQASSADIYEHNKYFETPIKNQRAWSPVRSVGSIVGTEVHPETDSVVFDSDSSRDSGVFGDDDDHGISQWTECDALWCYCSSGAVVVDPNQLPNWFNDNFSSISQAELSQSWRLNILENLRLRINEKDNDYSTYEKAIEMSSWVKTGEAKAAKPFEPFEDCILELEWVSSTGSGSDTGTFTILNPDGVTTKLQFSLSDITCVMCCSESGTARLAIHAPRLPSNSSPVKLQFNGDADLEDWMSHLTSVCCQINDVHGRPSDNSIWFTSNIGDVFTFDPSNLKIAQYQNDINLYNQEIDVSAIETPYNTNLYGGMQLGSILEIYGSIYDDADQIRFDLICHPTVRVRHKIEKLRQIVLHLNPRFNERGVIFNSMENSEWLDEIRVDNMVLAAGSTFKIVIRCESDGFRILIDDRDYYLYKYRNPPEAVSGLYVSGRVKLFKISYYNPSVIIPPRDMFLRQMGGHLKKVETCEAGITWGIGYDNTVWVYTGGWGGTFLKGLSTNSTGINPMVDTHIYYIYENQRWNPLSGYTSHGLPTDRNMWSDITGKQRRSKEHTKLLSIHWQWISDWLVDFHTPGGVDRDGWQYAVDFPASYHGKKQFTDYVRRRRWYRKCRLTTSGPWHELGNSKIIDLSLQISNEIESEENRMINVWAIASNGDALLRRGVTQQTPFGNAWDHVATEQPLISISCTVNDQVWAVGKNGSVFVRNGICKENILGDKWKSIECPNGVSFKQISSGQCGVWGLDTTGRLIIRREISSKTPLGRQWQILINIPNDPPHSEGNVGFKCISVGKEVWAISHTGYICKRCGITQQNPVGTGWNLGISGNFHHISVNSLS